MRGHQHQVPKHCPLVTEPLPDGTARQGQCDARRKIQADQDSDVGESNAEVAAEQRCYGGDALKLKAHGEANREQDGKNNPAIAQHLTPLNLPQLETQRCACQSRCKFDDTAHWHRR
jgi:hypothetical protein